MTTLQQRHQGPHHPFSLPTSSTLSPDTPLTLPSLIPVRITNRDTIASQRNSIANGLVNPEQLRQVRHTKQIPTTLTSTRIHNPANCVQITLATAMESTIASAPENVFVPSVLLSNVMSLAPKIDEIQHCVVHANFGLVCLTETWLKDCIQDEVVSISGFNIVRLDRKSQIHGGVCTYINESIQFSLMDDLVDPAFEVLWIKIRPSRLPRGFNCIIVGTVYHPPSASDSEMLNYLINCLSSIEAQSPNSGILLLGDFNKLKVTKLKSSFKLKQIITFPTRGSNTLDLILTNLHEFYNSPVQCPSFGLSDHMTIDLQPKTRSQQPKQRLRIKSRDLATVVALLATTFSNRCVRTSKSELLKYIYI